MKQNIHPDYHQATFECACGNKFAMGTTKKGNVVKVDICSQCHPFYTGTQKHAESGGRIDRFNKKRKV